MEKLESVNVRINTDNLDEMQEVLELARQQWDM